MPRAWPPSRTSARRSSRDDSPPPEPDCAGKAGARNASLHERDACFVALGQHLVGLGIDAHPAFGGGAGQRAAYLGRRAHRQHAVGHLGARRDERAAGHHRPDADAGAVQHGGSVADEALLAEPGRVHGAVVADRGAGADLDALGAVDVHDRAVLHVGAPVDDDRLEIGAHHRVVPDRGALLDRDVADDDRRRRDERRRMHARMLSLEAEQWHGCGPRSMLVVFSSYVRRALRRSRWTFLDWRRWRPPRPVSASPRPSCCSWPATTTRAGADSSRRATSPGATSTSIANVSGRTSRSTSSTIASAGARSSWARRPCGRRSRGPAGTPPRSTSAPPRPARAG